jgi:hypothetical protein
VSRPYTGWWRDAGATVLSSEPVTTDGFESPEQMAARLLRLAAEMRGAGREPDAKAVLAGAMAVRLSDLRRVTDDLEAERA